MHRGYCPCLAKSLSCPMLATASSALRSPVSLLSPPSGLGSRAEEVTSCRILATWEAGWGLCAGGPQGLTLPEMQTAAWRDCWIWRWLHGRRLGGARVWLRLSSWPLRGPLPACPSHPCLPQSWNR